MTKVGLACAGCGVGAEYAHIILEELGAVALPVEMISCTSLAAVPLLLFSYGCAPEEIRQEMEWIKKAGRGKHNQPCHSRVFRDRVASCPIAVNSVDVDTGITVIRADRLRSNAQNLKIHPLYGWENQALRETLSPWNGLEPAALDGMRLCDFSAGYGCPFFPLKMAGMERLLSVVFTGNGDPRHTAAESLSVLTGENADVHLTLRLTSQDPAGELRHVLRENTKIFYQRLLF